MPRWIDAHCHLADPRFAPDLGEVLARSRAIGVDAWLQGGVSPEDWTLQVGLSGLHVGVLPVFGLHPWWVADNGEADIFSALRLLKIALPSAYALGETGLDLMPKRLQSLPAQKQAFETQLSMAKEFAKPLILHVVKAHEPVLEALKRFGPFKRGGLVHAFSAGPQIAARYTALGFLISVGGGVSKEGREELRETVWTLAPDKLVLETDAPDQAPEKGKRNEPANLLAVARAAADLRGESPEVLLDRSAENLRRLLELK